jgi:hypothetical protein
VCGVPEPFAGMLRDHLTKRPNLPTTAGTLDTPWLFLGSRAGKHLDPQSIAPPTQNSGSISLGASNSAIQNLAAEVPPPLVAELLGYSYQVPTAPPAIVGWDVLVRDGVALVDLVFRSDDASRHRHGVDGSASGAGFGAAARGLRCPNYIGPTINRTGRLRDLAHGGQTVLSATTSDLGMDRLPHDAWLADLGVHGIRDLSRPEHIMQLCHPDLHNEFPPLRTSDVVGGQHLPAQLTSFGREAQMADVRGLLGQDRLVTLTGAGGIGKTRLAVRVATQMTAEFGDGAARGEGCIVNHKRVQRLSREEGLRVPQRRRRKHLGRSTTIDAPVADAPDRVWAVDFQ